MRTYHATVYYNQTVDSKGRHTAFLDGYQPGDPTKRIVSFDVEAEFPDEARELVYREMNIVDGTERPVALETRSMSVGDVVFLYERLGGAEMRFAGAFAVTAYGWDEVAAFKEDE